jgi:predicted ATP-dependent serine protease
MELFVWGYSSFVLEKLSLAEMLFGEISLAGAVRRNPPL